MLPRAYCNYLSQSCFYFDIVQPPLSREMKLDQILRFMTAGISSILQNYLIISPDQNNGTDTVWHWKLWVEYHVSFILKEMWRTRVSTDAEKVQNRMQTCLSKPDRSKFSPLACSDTGHSAICLNQLPPVNKRDGKTTSGCETLLDSNHFPKSSPTRFSLFVLGIVSIS